MTDIYLTISLFYTQRGWHTSELGNSYYKTVETVKRKTKVVRENKTQIDIS